MTTPGQFSTSGIKDIDDWGIVNEPAATTFTAPTSRDELLAFAFVWDA
jgi:hypothetical protein